MSWCKVVIAGDDTVGKTSFLLAFTKNKFPHDPPRFFEENEFPNYIVDGRVINISLWDTAGHEDYDRLRPLSYVSADVLIVAYSIDDSNSFSNISTKFIPEITKHCPTAPYVLVATKKDLRRDPNIHCITTEQGQELANRIDAAAFFEVSAKELDGLTEVMNNALKIGIGIIKNISKPHLPPKPDPPVILNGPDVCDDLELLVNEKLFHDVVFRVEDKEIYCHKIVLCSACPSLQKLIIEHSPLGEYFTSKTDGDVCVVSVSEVSHVELLEFIKFVYNGKAKQSPTNEFIQLAKVCDIDYNINRRTQMKKSIVANVNTMHDIEIIASDTKTLHAVKALLWCRSEYFHSLLSSNDMKQIAVDITSHLLVHFLDYVNEGLLPRDIDEEVLDLAKKVRVTMLNSIGRYLMESVINLKNVIEWTQVSRGRFPELHAYCVWFMRVNYTSIKDKQEFMALREEREVSSDWWPGVAYEYRYRIWKGSNGKKKDRCLVQ